MKKTGNAKVVVGYIRVSTSEQENGPEVQRSEIEKWCAVNGAQLVAVLEDRGISGSAPLDKRPALMEAIDALKTHGAGVLLVAKRDRLARDVIAAAMTHRLVERNGAKVMAANGAGNGEGPEQILMRQMLDAFAQYELALIRARTKAALAAKRARGEKTGGHETPYGWTLAADGVHLEANPAEQEIVRLAQGLREQGMSLRAIGRELAARGALPRSGGAWHPKTVRALTKAKQSLAGEKTA